MFGSVFDKAKVLVTGHTGFKGSWLCSWLNHLGAEVYGLSLEGTEDSPLFNDLDLKQRIAADFRGNVTDSGEISRIIHQVQPRFVFHLAAQAIVRESFSNPLETFNTNIMGTLNVLEAIRTSSSPTICVVVSSDKCYENKEWMYAYREEDAMGGYDPYSASKGCVEIATASYRRSFFSEDSPHRIASGRAGNVIGGGDWAKDRIVPDVFRALSINSPIPIRNKHATRPWQHVLEPLSGYMLLAARLASNSLNALPPGDISGSFNFGPSPQSNRTVVDVVQEILKHTSGSWVDASSPNAVHEAGKLNVAIDKAYHLLGWSPTWNFETAIEKTVDWYRAFQNSRDCYEFTLKQIQEYAAAAASQSNPWAKTQSA